MWSYTHASIHAQPKAVPTMRGIRRNARPRRTGPAPVISVKNVTVCHGKSRILNNVSFDVDQGKIIGLLGPSGAGKTTLIRCLVGLQQIHYGKAMVLGHPAGSAELRNLVGYVTQAPAVYSDLSIIENLRYFAAFYQKSEAEIKQVLEVLQLSPLQDSLIKDLSGGQRSRASLAITLLGNPKVIFLDEPTVGLDPVLRRELWRYFETLASSGVTLFISSHIMDEADRCDSLLFIRDGLLLANDTGNNLKRKHQTNSAEETFLRLAERDVYAVA